MKLGKAGKKRRSILVRQNRDSADAHARKIAPKIRAIRREGHRTVRALTEELNVRAVPTLRDGRWHAASIQHLLKRLEALGGAG